MARILVCLDDWPEAVSALTKYYDEQIRPSLIQRGHDVNLTTCVGILGDKDDRPTDILLMFVLQKSSTCWDTARHLRKDQGPESSTPLILMVIEWAPDDSPDNPAYYARPEYAGLYDDYYSDFREGEEIAKWIDDVLMEHLRG